MDKRILKCSRDKFSDDVNETSSRTRVPIDTGVFISNTVQAKQDLKAYTGTPGTSATRHVR